MTFLLATWGIPKTHSRPDTNDDNLLSEAQFQTLKYRLDFSERFGSLADARVFCQACFACYNGKHRHSGIGLMTHAVTHDGQASTVQDAQKQVRLTI